MLALSSRRSFQSTLRCACDATRTRLPTGSATSTGLARRAFTSGFLRSYEDLKKNKDGLPKELDLALVRGHDARAFRLGFWRSCANEEEYSRFMLAHYFFYSALERAFGAQPADSAMARLWREFPELRGAPRRLERDLRAAGVDATSATPSPASAAYVASLEEAAKDSALLIGHFYCRYLPDLLGGESLRESMRHAVGLPKGRPEFYTLPEKVESNRIDFVEQLYEALRQAGVELGPEGRARAVQGVHDALALSAAVYAEGSRPRTTAVLGKLKAASGYVPELFRLRTAPEVPEDTPPFLLPPDRRPMQPLAAH
eukprot:TRINITY_DN23525_c0_g1_i1.p1 TRINITY_DN23525_c0_g1~~TRINITY_DN23525_c0_g1_i1.p1  ORF type:complete len:314 (+),score=37.81 TRINITY_DN23525_c0_g1_i1:72-1013(+)